MIYKLVNYLKAVTVETEAGSIELEHQSPYYVNNDVCLEVKEISHNEIQVQVIQTNQPLHKVVLEFMNPIENLKAQLNETGDSTPFSEESKMNQCYICSDWGVYALGVEKDYGEEASFTVTPNYIKVEVPVQHSNKQCYRILFEKYLTIHPTQEIISRFNHQLGYSVAN